MSVENMIAVTGMLCALWSPPRDASADRVWAAQLADHQMQYNHLNDPEQLATPQFYERMYLLIKAEEEAHLHKRRDEERLYRERRGRSAWQTRKADICNPGTDLYGQFVYLEYKQYCPKKLRKQPDDDWSSTIKNQKGRDEAWRGVWYPGASGERDTFADELDIYTRKKAAEEGDGVLSVCDPVVCHVYGAGGAWDIELYVVRLAADALLQDWTYQDGELVARVGAILASPGRDELLELLAAADARQAMAIIEGARLLAAEFHGIAENAPSPDFDRAVATVRAIEVRGSRDVAARFDYLASNFPDLGNPLLTTALQNHLDVVQGVTLSTQRDGQVETYVVENIEAKDISGYEIRIGVRKISALDVTSFDLIFKG